MCKKSHIIRNSRFIYVLLMVSATANLVLAMDIVILCAAVYIYGEIKLCVTNPNPSSFAMVDRYP